MPRDNREVSKAILEAKEIPPGLGSPRVRWGPVAAQNVTTEVKNHDFNLKIDVFALKCYVFMHKTTQEHPGDMFS